MPIQLKSFNDFTVILHSKCNFNETFKYIYIYIICILSINEYYIILLINLLFNYVTLFNNLHLF